MKFIKILPLFLCSVFLFGFASSYKTEANSEPIRLPKEYYVARLDFKKKDLPPGVEVKTQIFNYTGEVWYTLVNKSKMIIPRPHKIVIQILKFQLTIGLSTNSYRLLSISIH